VTELTDKDALLLLALATKFSAIRVFLAGATAFVITTTIIVSIGTLAITVVPIAWIRIAGGLVMLAYGLWEARGLVGRAVLEAEEERLKGAGRGFRAFLSMVVALALLDLAGDATEVLTIVFVAQFADVLLVFSAAIVGLISATAVETALGNRLGKYLTPTRVRLVSVAIFVLLGAYILLTSLV
jgi:putative Ca2+/H+ antiporter (TMEM165/GDT1 family)